MHIGTRFWGTLCSTPIAVDLGIISLVNTHTDIILSATEIIGVKPDGTLSSLEVYRCGNAYGRHFAAKGGTVAIGESASSVKHHPTVFFERARYTHRTLYLSIAELGDPRPYFFDRSRPPEVQPVEVAGVELGSQLGKVNVLDVRRMVELTDFNTPTQVTNTQESEHSARTAKSHLRAFSELDFSQILDVAKAQAIITKQQLLDATWKVR